MKLSTRRILLYSLTCLFVVAGMGIILFSQGWRFDMSNFSFNKVGAIYIRSFPANAHIEINGKTAKNNSWLLEKGTLLNGLFPKKYDVKLSLEHYKPLKQTLTVKPSLVAEMPYAVLLPEEKTLVSSSRVDLFWLIGNQLITRGSDDHLVMASTTLRGNVIVGWSNNAGTILTTGVAGSYFINDTINNTVTPLASLFKKAQTYKVKVSGIGLDPEDDNVLLLREPSRIQTIDRSTSHAITISTSSISQDSRMALSRSFIVWTTYDKKQNVSTLHAYDRILQKQLVVTVTVSGKTLKLVSINISSFALLQDNGSLYLTTAPAMNIQKVASDGWEFEFNAKGTMVAVLEHQALEIISLEDQRDYWRFAIPDITAVKKISWYRDDRHLFLQYPDEVKFLDFKDEWLEHFDVVARTPIHAYDSDTNRFYGIDQNKVFIIDFPK